MKQTKPHPQTTTTSTVLAQGAEAIISLDKNQITKNRTIKSYRHPILDQKIRKSRTKREAKLLTKATEIINTPKVINQDTFTIQMQYIPGERPSETLNNKPINEQFQIMKQIGEQISKLHNQNIIHGDLTTSNTILANNHPPAPSGLGDHKSREARLSAARRDPTISDEVANMPARAHQDNRTPSSTISSPTPKVFLIDFGLGFISARIEDKAVDLHLIRQALEAKHFGNSNHLFFNLLEAYHPKERDQIIQQLKKVESRGRYKH